MPTSARNVLQFLYTGVVCDPQISLKPLHKGQIWAEETIEVFFWNLMYFGEPQTMFVFTFYLWNDIPWYSLSTWRKRLHYQSTISYYMFPYFPTLIELCKWLKFEVWNCAETSTGTVINTTRCVILEAVSFRQRSSEDGALEKLTDLFWVSGDVVFRSYHIIYMFVLYTFYMYVYAHIKDIWIIDIY